MKQKVAHYSLFALDFFNMNVVKVCDLKSEGYLCVINAIRPGDIFEAIAKRENDIVAQLKATGKLADFGHTFTSKDIYITHVNWVKDLYEQGDDLYAHTYKEAYDFITSHELTAVYGIDADETDTYLVVVHYEEVDV